MTTQNPIIEAFRADGGDPVEWLTVLRFDDDGRFTGSIGEVITDALATPANAGDVARWDAWCAATIAEADEYLAGVAISTAVAA